MTDKEDVLKEWDYDDTYARIPRGLCSDLQNGLLSTDEYNVLVWLMLNANCHNGIMVTSYEGLVSDLRVSGRNAKNKMNKTMLELKKKRYIWYLPQQGKKSGFQIAIEGYLLSSGRLKDTSKLFEQSESRSGEKITYEQRKSFAELIKNNELTTKESVWQKQKFDEEKDKENVSASEGLPNDTSRSTNNDNENDIEKEKKIKSSTDSQDYKEGQNLVFTDTDSLTNIPVSKELNDFKPTTPAERRVKEIAIWLGEKNIKFVLSKLKACEGDLTYIEEAYLETRKAYAESGDPNFNKGAYFNTVISGMLRHGYSPKN